MKTMMKLAVVLGVVAIIPGCSRGGAEGKYLLDKATVKAELEKQIEAAAADKKADMKFGLEMLDVMDVELELAPEGKAKTSTSMKLDAAPAEVKTEEGTWKLQEKSLIISTGGKDLRCVLDGGTIRCSDEGMTLIFKRV